MPHGGITGPMGGPRPLCSCELQIVFELQGEGDEDIDEDQLESQLDSELTFDVSVRTRPARFSDVETPAVNHELLVILGSSILNDDTFGTVESEVNSYLIQNSKLQMSEWRIEGA